MKILARLVKLWSAVYAIPVAIFIIIIRPLQQFRFRVLPVDEIGPLVRDSHHYLWGSDSSLNQYRDYWVSRPGTFISNQLVLEKLKSKLRFRQTWLAWFVCQYVIKFGGQCFWIPVDTVAESFPPRQYLSVLGLSHVELAEFERQITNLGIDLNRPLMALIVRDDAYKSLFRVTSGFVDRKENYRNQDISMYSAAAEAVAQSGGMVIRMGVISKEPLQQVHPKVFDYSFSGLRTELVDLGIISKAKLCVTSSLGFDYVASHFGVKRCVVGLFPYRTAKNFFPYDHVIFRLLRDRRDGRILNLRSSAEFARFEKFRGDSDLEVAELELIPNSPSEIKDVVLEAWREESDYSKLPKSDRLRQERFWQILEEVGGLEPRPFEERPRIGVGFLRHHEWWLD